VGIGVFMSGSFYKIPESREKGKTALREDLTRR